MSQTNPNRTGSSAAHGPDAAPGAEDEHSERSVERVKAFTDAVVAIALTLLVLPLLDTVSEVAREQVAVGEWAHEHYREGLFFVMSFVLISRYWQGHERIFRHARSMSGSMFRVNALWMFGIVWMPVGTALLSARSDPTQVVLYIGSMLLCGLAQSSLAIMVGRQPGSTMPTRLLAVSLSNTLLMALSMVLALSAMPTIAPDARGAAYGSLWILAFTGLLAKRLDHPARRLLHRLVDADHA